MNLSFPNEEEKYVQLISFHELNNKLSIKDLNVLQKCLLTHDITVLSYPDIEVYYKGTLLKSKIKDLDAYERLVNIVDSQIVEYKKLREKEKEEKEERRKRSYKNKRNLKINGYDVMEIGELKQSKLVGDILTLVEKRIEGKKRQFKSKTKQIELLKNIIKDLKLLDTYKKTANLNKDIPF